MNTRATTFPEVLSSSATHGKPPVIVLRNISDNDCRAILHDEKIYPNAENFSPSRFLTEDGTELRKDVMEPELAAFGFGRRKCPGRYLAMDSLWIAMAYLLTCYDIEKPLDKNGEPIEPSGQYTTGLLRYERYVRNALITVC